MDRRSWLWRRKSSPEKSPGETESSGSVSSERCSDEQEVLNSSTADSSPSHAKPSKVSPKDVDDEEDEALKSLNEKLSAALLSVSAKEELAKQHAKLAEEAVLGWENAEKELSCLKLHLEAAKKKNASLEDRIGHLDGALRECVRQLRQSKDEQEQKIHDAIVKKTHELESDKSDLEIQLIAFQAKLEAKAETSTSFEDKLSFKIKALKDENSALNSKIGAITEDLQLRTLETELSTRAAETASKQHLQSIKKIAKLEAECLRLRAAARKLSLPKDYKLIPNSFYVESVTDSQSDSGERLLGLDNEPTCSDSWASALIAELDQFKNEKASAESVTSPAEIDPMDDFLEMEKLAALPAFDHAYSSFEQEADLDSSSRNELKILRQQIIELEEKFEKIVVEKADMQMSLNTTDNHLKYISDQLLTAEGKVTDLQRQLNLVNGEKHMLETELEAVEAKRNEVELQLELAHKEIERLQISICSLERRVEEEKTRNLDTTRSQDMDAMEAKRKKMESELESASKDIIILQDNMSLLEGKLEEEKTLSAEYASRCRNMDALEAQKIELNFQLESANLELFRLNDKVVLFERKIKTVNTKKTELENQLSSRNLESVMLKEKVSTLEAKVEYERTLSTKCAANVEATEAKRKELVLQLELAHKEVENLQNKLDILESKVEEEKALSAELAAKCQALEYEPTRTKGESETQMSSLCAMVKTRQEKEIAVAAGKFAECRKTIASLSQQLKSLATLGDLSLETDKSQPNGDELEQREKFKVENFSVFSHNFSSTSALAIGK